MTDGNTHAIAQHLDEREDWDALQEVTVELEQAESDNILLIARIEELEAEMEEQVEWVKGLADDLIAAEGREARLKEKLEKAIDFVAEVGGGFKFGESLVDWANLHVLKARTLLAELKGETDEV